MKKLNIYDIHKNYYIDEITCFEHPIAIAMNYYNRQCCFIYIILAKLYGIYMIEDGEKVRDTVFENVKETLGISMVEYSNISWNIIKKNIDEGNPVIVGVNLKSVFYSGYYMKRDWGHWILINGYDEQNKTLNIIDNAQYRRLGEKYDEFVITYDMLYRAAKDYKKSFGKRYSSLSFRKEGDFCYKDALITVLKRYVNINYDDWSVYRQVRLLKELNDIYDNESDYIDYYREEFKKKIININKYRKIFFDEIINTMTDNHYGHEKINLYNSKVAGLNEKWEKFILLDLLKASRGRFVFQKIEEEIVKMEKDVAEETARYIEYITRNSTDEGKVIEICKNEITYELVNNNENIIYGHNNEIVFDFSDKRVYNWWIEDDAPKVFIYSGNYDFTDKKNIRIGASVEIVRNINSAYDELLQAGIFVHTNGDNRNYMCGIEGKEKWILDRVGYDGQHRFINNKYGIDLKIYENKIVCEYSDKDSAGENNNVFEQDINTEGGIIIGLACKTWQKPGNVKVYFRDVCLETID